MNNSENSFLPLNNKVEEKKIKILHVQTVVTQCGNAPYRLHRMLLKNGFDSHMIALTKNTDDSSVTLINKENLWGSVNRSFTKFKELYALKRYGNKDMVRKNKFNFFSSILRIFRTSGERLIYATGDYGLIDINHNLIKEADIIHLHWINGSFVSLEDVAKLGSMNKKLVWSFHDSWPFTGGCHVRYGCEKFVEGCGGCPVLKSDKKDDLSGAVIRKKKDLFAGKNIFDIIIPSWWSFDKMSKGDLFNGYNINVISNCLDADTFKPINKSVAREVFNLASNKKYILFGAVNISIPYKGWRFLKEALILLKEELLSDEVELLVFGSTMSDSELEDIPFKLNFFGSLHNESSLVTLYSAADVFVGPSLEESFGQVFNESIHCGTPAVAFDETGATEIISHMDNGYLAKYADSADLAAGIKYWLDNAKPDLVVKDNLKEDVILKQLLDVYRC